MLRKKSKISDLIKNQQGIATLTIVIIITAVSLTLALTGMLSSLDENINQYHQERALETFVGADGCLEKGLYELNSDRDNYTGESYTISNVDCVITVTGSGTTRNLNIVADINSQYTREIEADVDWSSDFTITNWEEKTD